MSIIKTFNFRDFELTVAGDGTAVSELCLKEYVLRFATKCDVATLYEIEFKDKDDFGVWKEDGVQYTGPISRPVHAKCASFRIHVSNATPGAVIKIRVGVE